MVKKKAYQLTQYEIFVPRVDLSGKKLPGKGIKGLRKDVVKYFGGITESHVGNQGLWKLGKATIRDQIIIWKILSDKGQKGDKMILTIKSALETFLHQDEILVLAYPVKKLG